MARNVQDVLSGDALWHVETCDVLDGLRMLPDGCIHCVVDSPPYWGLRDYGVDGQLGLEKTPDQYVAAMVDVFREVRRVLRGDGTLWLNIGDSYNAQPGQRKPTDKVGPKQETNAGSNTIGSRSVDGLKPKDLVGIPWMLAFALRADGWYLRSEIIWHKRAPMPESVTDRPTKAHEQVFLLTKSRRYFYDAFAASEPVSKASVARLAQDVESQAGSDRAHAGGKTNGTMKAVGGTDTRNLRSVWPLSPESFGGSHFATMPTELARRCLLAGTSEKGCCSSCGAPWRRVLEKERAATRPGTGSKVGKREAAIECGSRPGRPSHPNIVGNRDPQRHTTTVTTAGWEPGCKCEQSETRPCVVLDPFNGAATTGVVARRLGLRYVGFELNPEYAEMSRRRILEDMPLLNGASA